MKKIVLTLLSLLTSIVIFATPTAVQVDCLMSGLVDSTGAVLNGGLVYTYLAGTSTPVNLFIKSDESSQATNPITLDQLGRARVYGDGIYKFIVKSSTGRSIFSMDNVAYMYQATTFTSSITMNNVDIVMANSGRIHVNGSGIAAVDSSGVKLFTSNGTLGAHVANDGSLNADTGVFNILGGMRSTINTIPTSSTLVLNQSVIVSGTLRSTGYVASGDVSALTFSGTSSNGLVQLTGPTTIAGALTINGAISAPGGINDSPTVNVYSRETFQIGSWTMTQGSTRNVTTNISSASQVRRVSVMVVDDNGVVYDFLAYSVVHDVQDGYNNHGNTPIYCGSIDRIVSGGIVLKSNLMGGGSNTWQNNPFGSSPFIGTGYNRGWVTVEYER